MCPKLLIGKFLYTCILTLIQNTMENKDYVNILLLFFNEVTDIFTTFYIFYIFLPQIFYIICNTSGIQVQGYPGVKPKATMK
jgi:hypothetical protein